MPSGAVMTTDVLLSNGQIGALRNAPETPSSALMPVLAVPQRMVRACARVHVKCAPSMTEKPISAVLHDVISFVQ